MPGVQETIVRDHCVDRFIEYSRVKRPDRDAIRSKILDMVKKSKRVVLKPGYRANNVIKNGFRVSTFKRYSDWIFVLDTEGSVVTCYPSSALKWAEVAEN